MVGKGVLLSLSGEVERFLFGCVNGCLVGCVGRDFIGLVGGFVGFVDWHFVALVRLLVGCIGRDGEVVL